MISKKGCKVIIGLLMACIPCFLRAASEDVRAAKVP